MIEVRLKVTQTGESTRVKWQVNQEGATATEQEIASRLVVAMEETCNRTSSELGGRPARDCVSGCDYPYPKTN